MTETKLPPTGEIPLGGHPHSTEEKPSTPVVKSLSEIIANSSVGPIANHETDHSASDTRESNRARLLSIAKSIGKKCLTKTIELSFKADRTIEKQATEMKEKFHGNVRRLSQDVRSSIEITKKQFKSKRAERSNRKSKKKPIEDKYRLGSKIKIPMGEGVPLVDPKDWWPKQPSGSPQTRSEYSMRSLRHRAGREEFDKQKKLVEAQDEARRIKSKEKTEQTELLREILDTLGKSHKKAPRKNQRAR